jgi:hypothetical protein
VRCSEFYDKWRRDPNWCEKSPDTVKLISQYLGLLDEMAALGVPNPTMVGLLPERSARPLFTVEDPKIRGYVLERIKEMVEHEEEVSGADIRVWIYVKLGRARDQFAAVQDAYDAGITVLAEMVEREEEAATPEGPA